MVKNYKYFKYWGKKSKSIFGDFINEFSNKNDSILDPFAGSGTTFFSTQNRKITLRDINKVQIFIFNSMISQNSLQITKIEKRVKEILIKIKKTKIYNKVWIEKEEEIKSKRIEKEEIFNYINKKWEKTQFLKMRKNKLIDYKFLDLMEENEKYEKSFNSIFFRDIWDEESYEILCLIFQELSNSKEDKIIFTCFLKACHLSTKSNAYRVSRPTSSGWGRPEIMNLSKRIIINPLILFERAFFGNQGLKKFLQTFNLNNQNVSYEFFNILNDKKDFKYDLIITDPPYSDIIQYDKLSLVWEVWLSKFLKYSITKKKKLTPSLSLNLIKRLIDISYEKLKNNKYCIFSYNTKKEEEIEEIEKIILEKKGMKLIKIINKSIERSSESNVGKNNWHNIDKYFIVRKE